MTSRVAATGLYGVAPQSLLGNGHPAKAGAGCSTSLVSGTGSNTPRRADPGLRAVAERFGVTTTSAPHAREAVGRGFLFALLLLLLPETLLHTDTFLYRYRSVFAAGRAMDKLRYVEAHVPGLLILGNSRIDNGLDPIVIADRLGVAGHEGIFNLALPGSDTRTLYGLLERLDRNALLGPGRIAAVLIGLDEDYLQAADGLGYEVFFADRATMFAHGEYVDLARSLVRLWGYADNLKELRDPARLERFLRASRESIEPTGGGAAEFKGYRAGFRGLQDAGQASMQEAGSRRPPDIARVAYLQRSMDLLHARGVGVAFVHPPLLNRDVLYLTPHDPAAPPYIQLEQRLRAQRAVIIGPRRDGVRSPAEFVNAGHLNDVGARRFSAEVADGLAQAWPDLATRLSR